LGKSHLKLELIKSTLNFYAMKSLKFVFTSLISILFVTLLLLSCKKNETPTVSQSGDPIITEVGEPTGDAATAPIGSSGGTISSLDGNLTVTIPAGALSTTTTISIQPITNTAPLGIGDGYRLLPEGTTFSKPVQLVYHYDTTLLNRNSPYLLWFATQASDGSWDAMLDSEVDTIQNTVTVESTHFSNWVIGNCLQISLNPQNAYVKLNEVVDFKVSSFILPKANTSNHTKLIASASSGGTDILTPNDINITNWNSLKWIYDGKDAPYNDERGSLTPSGKTAAYIAPGVMPENNIATVFVPIEVYIKKQKKTLNNSVYSKITIGDHQLKIKIDGLTVATYPVAAVGFSKGMLAISVTDSTLHTGLFQFYNATAGTHKIATTCTGKNDIVYYWPNRNHTSLCYRLEYSVRNPNKDGCYLVDACGSGTFILNPFTKKVGANISGRVVANVYFEDISKIDCDTQTPTSHYLECEFYLPINVVQ
jgi:hypothetical protein